MENYKKSLESYIKQTESLIEELTMDITYFERLKINYTYRCKLFNEQKQIEETRLQEAKETLKNL